ncbi:virulence factor [Xylanibacillus composti]|uniref:PBS lyase n=1 Tax=Xylanibacillus composti TaxID=1572762 RepID=A0A8J4M238_9BACL|nr:conserved virulence factor C family protein [Xylanibacillus composti]MDT9724293.1 virulence factor [Xylanibacillus composti]GIQ69289.1 PBS lyase [Xylanibacillus composti]
MNIVSIEPTPSPNTMKLNMDERVSVGKTYTTENARSAPPYIRSMLEIEGIKSIFHTADFIALDRVPGMDWKPILTQVREVFGQRSAEREPTPDTADGFGEVRVFVQTFRRIPMQIRVRTEQEEVREGLPARFTEKAMEAGLASPNLIKERKLEDWGIRYGDPRDIAEQVLQELDAAYDDERLNAMVRRAQQAQEETGVELDVQGSLDDEEVLRLLEADDWRKRYAALERWEPSAAGLAVIEKALDDKHMSVRRLAVVHIGELEADAALPLLFRALKDDSPAVRRTAGDTISDLGDKRAMEPMIEALKDANKLVRWRAARFLYEAGDERAVPALKQAVDDPEFEVSLQAAWALERIEGGEEAVGTVWQQMTRERHGNG